MALFRFLWLRRLVRRNTSPIEESRAGVWKNRLAIVYAVVAWNAFGIVAYMIYNGKSDWAKYYGVKNDEDAALSPGYQWAKTLGMKDAKVYRVKGLSIEPVKKEDETEIVNTQQS